MKFKNLNYFLISIFVISGCSIQSVRTNNEEQSKSVISDGLKSSTASSSVSADLTNASSDSVEVDKQNNAFKKSVKPRLTKPTFDWPVWEARMTRGYLPKGTKRRRRPHKGIDLAAPRGTPVMSSHDGMVLYTGSGFKGYGKMIMVESLPDMPGSGFVTLYGHLDKIVVYEGQQVKQGEVIGALGNTGRSSGPHLHFEIRKLNGPIDPLPYLPAGDALTNEVDNGAKDE